jgi:hypothetical protein
VCYDPRDSTTRTTGERQPVHLLASPLMPAHGRAVLFGALVFAIAMGALERGGWWWAAWFTALVVVLLRRGIHLPPLRVKLNPATAYILRENRKARRHNRELTRRQRHRQRQQRRVQRARRRQTQ